MVEHWRATGGQPCTVHECCRMGQCAHSGANTGGLQKPTDKLFRCVCTQCTSTHFIPSLHFITCVIVKVDTALSSPEITQTL